MKVPVKIIYNKYTLAGYFVKEMVYEPKTLADYDRVMHIFETDPIRYEVVNVEYEEATN